MKIVTVIARLLLGVVFFVFGLNGLFHFFAMPPMPPAAQEFLGALVKSGYLFTVVAAVQTLCGALLLAGLFVPLALVLLAPIMVNIVLFHVFLTPVPGEVVPAFVLLALQIFLMWQYRDYYHSLFAPWAKSAAAAQGSAAGGTPNSTASREPSRVAH